MKRLIATALDRAGLRPSYMNAKPPAKESNPDISEREWKIISAVQPFTMISIERILTNIRAVQYVIDAQIPGDIVECGVWRGGSAMAIAMTLEQHSRRIWMYDTYSGMTEATDADRLASSGEKAQKLLAKARANDVWTEKGIVAYASLEDVQSNMASTGYPTDRINYIEGPVEETIPTKIPDQIAFLRLDTDWYQSTRHELEHLYPRLSANGVLIIDDYGHWLGARQAVDEYFRESPVFLNRIDYTGRLLIKPVLASRTEASSPAHSSRRAVLASQTREC